ncbi:hypothetical protein ACQEU8_27970 [Streptomyces sp. CA-250714]|uniref:hypothetical protein n=1 Tax=Streptomyces sp. CA-250714 TaxID=3240060 RepID=UPI003D92A8EB
MAKFSYTDLIELNLGKLKSAVDDWKTMVDDLAGLKTMATDGLQAKANAAAWKGANATVTKKFVTATAKEIGDLHAEAKSIHAVLDDAHTELSRLQKLAKALTSEARSGSPDIESNNPSLLVFDGKGGTVRVSPMECRVDGYIPARAQGLIDYYAENLTDLVAHAAEIDKAARDLLRKSHGKSPHNAGHGKYPSLDAAQLPRAMKLAAQGDSGKEEKAELRRLWRSLSPGARAELWEKHKDGLKDAGIFGPTVKRISPDAGSGRHGAREPGVRERLTEAEMLAFAGGGGWLGMSDASRYLDHYLSNDGSPLEISVDKVMDDSDDFKEYTEELIKSQQGEWREKALQEFKNNGNRPVSIPVETGANGYRFDQDDDPNWFYAIGSAQANVTGVVTVKPDDNGDPKVDLDYQVNMWDRYNWSKGKGIHIGPISVPDGQPASLHETGLAKEFDVSGNSSVLHRELADTPGEGTFPEPEGPGLGRDGGRADPDRQL